MSQMPPERAELLSQVASESDPEFFSAVAAWVTPERIEFLLHISSRVADCVIPSKWSEPLPGDDPKSEALVSQPGFVMLNALASGRESAADGHMLRVPEEMVLHFARLMVLMETDRVTPEIFHAVGRVAEAEKLAREVAPGASEQHRMATDQLDRLMEAEIAKNEDLENYVGVVCSFVVTSHEDWALRLDWPS